MDLRGNVRHEVANQGLVRRHCRAIEPIPRSGRPAQSLASAASVLALPLLLIACERTVLVANYASAVCSDLTAGRDGSPVPCRTPMEATVSAILAPAPAAASRSGTTFPEHALAAYVAALAQPRMSSSAAKLRANLAAPIMPEQEPPTFLDSSFTRGLLTVTVAGTGFFPPTDRIERATITICPIGGEFSDWVSARTAYSQVSPGSIQTTSQTVLKANASVSPPTPVPFSVGGSAESNRGRTERLEPTLLVEDITVRVERRDGASSAAADTPCSRDATVSEMIIERSGGFGRDLRGNAQVEVTLRSLAASALATVFRVQRTDGNAQLQLSSQVRRVLAEPITAHISMDYVVRHVVSGGDTIEQADDHVQFIRRNVDKPMIVLAPATVLFGLRSRHGNIPGFLRIRRHANDSHGVELCFDREEDARTIQDYLIRARPTRIGGQQIGFRFGENLRLAAHDHGYEVHPQCGEWTRDGARAQATRL